jgi:hypothetical protein
VKRGAFFWKCRDRTAISTFDLRTAFIRGCLSRVPAAEVRIAEGLHQNAFKCRPQRPRYRSVNKMN